MDYLTCVLRIGAESSKEYEILNQKMEFNKSHIPRLIIADNREKREVEIEKEDLEILRVKDKCKRKLQVNPVERFTGKTESSGG